jgi:hypothetical protein
VMWLGEGFGGKGGKTADVQAVLRVASEGSSLCFQPSSSVPPPQKLGCLSKGKENAQLPARPSPLAWLRG